MTSSGRIAVAASLCLAALGAAAQGTLAKADQRFAEQAAADGLAEVALGQLAQQKGQSDAVKQYGARMVQDHGQANDELKRIAGAKGAKLPDAPNSMQQADQKKLEALSGAAFDREYARHMQADHRKAVQKFRQQANSGKDAELKAFAGKTLPTLEEHLKMAQALSGTAPRAGASTPKP